MRKSFEKILLFSNNFTLLPVVFGLLGAIVLFVIASYDVGKVFCRRLSLLFRRFSPGELPLRRRRRDRGRDRPLPHGACALHL